MKKIFIIYGVLIAAIIIVALIKLSSSISLPFGSKQPTAQIEKTKIQLMVAKNEQDRAVGLSNKEKLDENHGMLFVFDKKDYHSFWMKNMKFPIDIIFLDDNTIVDIYKNVTPPKPNENMAKLPIYRPHKQANYVLEVPAGTADKNHIKIGDTISLHNLPK